MSLLRTVALRSAPQVLLLAAASGSVTLTVGSETHAQTTPPDAEAEAPAGDDGTTGEAPATEESTAAPEEETPAGAAGESEPGGDDTTEEDGTSAAAAEETEPAEGSEGTVADTAEQPAAGAAPLPQPAAGEPSPAPGAGSLGFGAYPNPAEDEEDLIEQGEERPTEVQPDRVFAEEWWAHTRPTLELHGNFRVRTNLYHNFHLNRLDSPESALWPRPADDYYTDLNGTTYGAQVCTPDEVGTGASDDPSDATVGCSSPTQGGADMRFRIEPAIIISDNLRVKSQIDLFSNLVMGSTAQGNVNFPAATGGGYAVGERSGYVPVSGWSTTQEAPISGVNSLQDAVKVNRAWAEYDTPVGALKFGRMPDDWGLGIMYNAGDDLDGDYQSTVDRIAFTTGLPAWSLYVGGAWDFQDEGATSIAFADPGGPAYDLSQRDDVSRINLQIYRKMDPQLEELALKKGQVVVNGGLYLSYRWQRLANDYSGSSATCNNGADALDCQPGEVAVGYVRRGMKIWTPDVYGEVKYKKFYAGIEVVTHQGSFESLGVIPGDNDYEDPNGNDDGWRVNQWAFAGEIEQKLIEDRLLLGFHYGYATGDGDVDSLVPVAGVQPQFGDRSIETFRFHPGYRVDLILNRHILGRVQGSYYVKPMAQYDFIRKADGLKLGGRAEAIWTRASQFMQTPGHRRDLGVELNATVYYQSKDGHLNTRKDLTGGFFGMVQYGVAFPLGGLGYQSQESRENVSSDLPRLKPAQMVRGFFGVAF